ncbi:ABC transporter permease [Streptomyces flavofungini]|uniref:ABC transporter permease n=1 Tax=Streptomyces flavofungini TaxID=68200 RepID=A0ABS0XH37_9ACTN|nr:ABC transporter permease [Streptomyces flavofungini]MBJ3812513.1 ABC transporter permease [Streptomyces flavofungini]GHC88754.1 ABC transporter permease [Streptomyces flavofungini]
MTTGTATGTAPYEAGTTGDPAARFRDLLAAEWLKLWSLRSTPWAYLITALAVIGFNVGQAYDTYRYWTDENAGDADKFIRDGIPLAEAFTSNAVVIHLLAAGAIGAVTVVGEYGTGLIRTTFAAVPARRAVMAAKAAVVAVVTTAFGALVAFVSFFSTQAILSARDIGVFLDHPGALRVVAASALLTPVAALVGMAIGTLLRHMGSTMIVTVATLLVLPMVVSPDRYWSALIAHALPFPAWRRLTEPGAHFEAYPWSTGGAWTVYALWALAAVAVTVFSVDRRDQ